MDDELTWDICGRIKAEGKLENCVKEGRGRMKMGGEKQCLKPRATLEFTSNGKEKKRFTHKQVNAHTHTHYTCLMLRSVCMLGHTDWVLQVLFTHACMACHYAMKKALMGWFQRALPALSASKSALRSLCNFPSLSSAQVILWWAIVPFSPSFPLILNPAACLSFTPHFVSVLDNSLATLKLCCINNNCWLNKQKNKTRSW